MYRGSPKIMELVSVPDQLTVFDQVSEVPFQGVAVAASQPDSFSDCFAPMFTGNPDDLQKIFGHECHDDLFSLLFFFPKCFQDGC